MDQETPKKKRQYKGNYKPSNPRKRKYIKGPVPTEPEYTASHAERVIPLMEQGKHLPQILAEFDICYKTWNNWMRDHEEFSRAVEIGKPKLFAWWLQKSQEAMERGDDRGVKYYTLIMNNMFADQGWVSPYNKSPQTNISIGNMNVLNADRSQEEILESIKANARILHDTTREQVIEALPELKQVLDGS